MMVLGEGKNPTVQRLLKMAKQFSLPEANQVIDQVQEAVNNWPSYADEAGVSGSSTKMVQEKIQKIYRLK